MDNNIYILQAKNLWHDTLLKLTVFFVAKIVQPSKMNA